MIYIEITKHDEKFDRLNIENILLRINKYSNNIHWSLQIIEAVGNIKNVVGMDMLSLEKKCDSSSVGVLLQFDTIIELFSACDDVIDVLLIGCKNQIPKAYRTEGWENYCDIIISKEDSSIWQLYSKNENIMDVFKSM